MEPSKDVPLSPSEQNLQEAINAWMHAVQSGVAMSLEQGSQEASPKHLRVGVNSAMCQVAALMHLLVDKGIITREEFMQYNLHYAQKEVDIYTQKLSKHFGVKVTLY